MVTSNSQARFDVAKLMAISLQIFGKFKISMVAGGVVGLDRRKVARFLIS
jgi:hypothetical protein